MVWYRCVVLHIDFLHLLVQVELFLFLYVGYMYYLYPNGVSTTVSGCAVLWCGVVCCDVLCCAVLCCGVLCCTVV